MKVFKKATIRSRVSLVLILCMLFAGSAFALPEETEPLETDETVSTEPDTETSEPDETTDSDLPKEFIEEENVDPLENVDATAPGSTASPNAIKASIETPYECVIRLKSNSYSVPNPNTAVVMEKLSVGTRVWVVEKAYCADNGKYYYYVGFNLNGEAHRGYIHESNVGYKSNSAKIDPAIVSNETKPAAMKTQTSKAGTVYDGPGTSYSKMGSVGAESVQLIRTEGNYNFIQYKVDSSGKYKRGYLHYSLISGPWASLTAKNKALDGKTFYLQNTLSNKYLSTYQNKSNERMRQYDFDGTKGLIYKFHYNAAGQYFTIHTVNGYTSNMRMGMSTSGEHADRPLRFTAASEINSQRFWVVRTEGSGALYKIVPVSSYGTMTLASRPSGTTNFVNQYYTDTTSETKSRDIWKFESTMVETYAWQYSEPADHSRDLLCWAYAAKMAVNQYYAPDRSIEDGVKLIKGTFVNKTASLNEAARISNYYYNGNQYDENYVAHERQIYAENTLRQFIHDRHALYFAVNIGSDVGHAMTLVAYYWQDAEDTIHAPGFFRFLYYDPEQQDTNYKEVLYEGLTTGIGAGDKLIWNGRKWTSTIALNTSYHNNTIDV